MVDCRRDTNLYGSFVESNSNLVIRHLKCVHGTECERHWLYLLAVIGAAQLLWTFALCFYVSYLMICPLSCVEIQSKLHVLWFPLCLNTVIYGISWKQPVTNVYCSWKLVLLAYLTGYHSRFGHLGGVDVRGSRAGLGTRTAARWTGSIW